jgi:23S rRNA pseudouridine1911/1915/1917 synthase
MADDRSGAMTGDRSGAMTDDRTVAIRVPPDAAGRRLDQFLAVPLGSRARAQRLIDAGLVQVDGLARPKRYAVSAGQTIEVIGEPDAPSISDPEDVEFAIRYEDEYLLVVDKPPGVVVHPARGHRSGTLAQALTGIGAGGDEAWRAGIVHRLDRGTSGLLVVAKRDDVHRALRSLLRARRMRREYLALVEGRPESKTGTIDAPIGRHRRERTLMSIDSDFTRTARTHFAIERLLATTTLLRVSLETGRTHQIRVHMAAIGHPVCGDPEYGRAGVYGLRRQFLHAERLTFEHPITDEEIDVHAPLPQDLVAALDRASEPQSQR